MSFVMRPGAILPAALLFVVADRVPAQRPFVVPPPRGMLSDFANVVSPPQAVELERIARFVRERSGGEIAVVTLPDLGGRDVADVALAIGREWKVGAKADIGDPRRNTGVVVLVVPKETSSDGRGHISIQTGQGVEGFIPDAVAGRIRREGTELFRRGDYGGGLLLITRRLAERYAANFEFSLDPLALPEERAPERLPGDGIPPAAALVIFIAVVLLLAGGTRGGCLWFPLGYGMGRTRRRRHHVWHGGAGSAGWWGSFGDSGRSRDFGGFGSGGGGGGGFGGFGGGGGFSGGGSSGSW